MQDTGMRDKVLADVPCPLHPASSILSSLLRCEELFDQRVLRLQNFGGSGVFAGDVFAGPLVGFGEGVFFDGDVVGFGDGALWRRRGVDGDWVRVEC